MPRTLLIDGDILLYRCGFATEKKHYLITTPEYETIIGSWDNAADANVVLEQHPGYKRWERRELEPVENALALAKQVLEKLHDKYPDSKADIYLSPPVGNFRDTLAVTQKYKGNRDNQQRPAHFNAIRKYLIDKWGASVADGQEADDEIGIRMQDSGDYVCVSNDKDLDQLPGFHHNWVTGAEYRVSPRDGVLSFYQQVLAGDATDNVKGVPGIGPEKAKKILESAQSPLDAYKIVKSIYDEKGLSSEYLLEQARLVYIRRKENEMWSPPV